MHQWCMAYESALAHAKAASGRRRDDARPLRARCSTRRSAISRRARVRATASSPRRSRWSRSCARARRVRRVPARSDRWQSAAPGRAVRVGGAPCASPRRARSSTPSSLELYPDLVDAAADAFQADERFELVPEMPVAELRELRARATTAGRSLADRPTRRRHYFWYRSTARRRATCAAACAGATRASRPRRTMDTVLQTQRLWACLADAADARAGRPTSCIARPDLRHIVARVQSLAGLRLRGVARSNWLADDFSPFATIRFALSFFGLEKFEAAPPKSVRGMFMQGAPIAEDVAAGRRRRLAVSAAAAAGRQPRDLALLAPLPVSHADARLRRSRTRRAELSRSRRASWRAWRRPRLQGHGAALGVAEDAAGLVDVRAGAADEPAVAALLRHCDGRCDAELRRSRRATTHAAFDSRVSRTRARLAAPRRRGSVHVAVRDPWLARRARAARRATRPRRRAVAGATRHATQAGFAVAGPGDAGPGASSLRCRVRHARPRSPMRAVRACRSRASLQRRDALPRADSFRHRDAFAIVCSTGACDETGRDALAALATLPRPSGTAPRSRRGATRGFSAASRSARVEFDALARRGPSAARARRRRTARAADGVDP